MNYGHNLQFGTFITPSNKDPQNTVSLAKRSEELGYDLVTFQDHPYQPAFLDTWTLMSWVAGQTERIHIAANVHNLPLRDPAILARSAASLDQLSNGRLDLALGAGAFWAAIEAMGGRKLSASESVDALTEAIAVIRGLLDVGSGTPFSYDGDYYHLKGAERGPLPLHDIPIWLGAYKPRMLRLIGQKADGWLPSLGYMKPGDLQSGNQIIDKAANEAGRDPREIRRMLNISGQFHAAREGLLQGPASQWVEELLPLIVEDGISTFILMADDMQIMEQFAEEVVPALREAAYEAIPELAHGGVQIRRAEARAKRRQGIDYDHVPASLAHTVIEPGDIDYARVKSTYMRGGAPGIVFQVNNTDEVIDALAFARKHPNLPMGIRSGGHGISGRSTNNGGIIIDLSHMNQIEILDEASRRVRIGPGARWMDVAIALAPYGWGMSSGDYGGVGVGGLATAGGIGWLSRKHGLTIDHVRAVEMVLADGSVVRASEEENADLFWAVRGAGGNFGIVTSFEFEVYDVGNIGWAQLVFDASDAASFLKQWGAAVEAAPRDLTSFLIMGPPRRGQPPIAQVLAVVDSDQPDKIINILQPLANIAPMYDQNVVLTPYTNIIANAQSGYHDGYGEPIAHSGLIEHITPEFARDAAQFIYSGATYFFQIRAVGGAVSDVPPDATAYGYRSANFSIAAMGASHRQIDPAWRQLSRHFKGMYLNFETDQHPDRLQDAFPPQTLERLQALKQQYDPDNVFRDNFNLSPIPEKQ
ncbi:LLM class flavin-dependent oxidoreductase [Phototrophicus methaneseepsis]|uniref:LLM class flavin-dependent oxidoreductase n=1 Tax=Phototrophicus methaneseepsis TaxID=2710758 RepID=A0A7S8ICA8_9CHLR|nr:LLM class flavin-dependent oxidoreductase [Phototrophicus methaneseepsis]QPC81345.1 LLM class flavin-dependent oxidoreductase [Phototrophicus methaneseepsis]